VEKDFALKKDALLELPTAVALFPVIKL